MTAIVIRKTKEGLVEEEGDTSGSGSVFDHGDIIARLTAANDPDPFAIQVTKLEKPTSEIFMVKKRYFRRQQITVVNVSLDEQHIVR